MKRLALLLGFVVASLGIMAGTASAYANTPIIDPSYNSRIIDDTIFTNYGTMSVDAIQAFLNSKVPTCDSNHPNPDGSAPSTPYICLKDYVDPSVGKRASQIIWDTAQEFNVNPRVILVTLQKEQSLVTDTWPYPSQYRSAMGYGCPESQSVCDSQYYGFYNQVRLGTKLLRVGYDRNCGNTTSYPGWNFGAQWAKGNTTPVDGRDTFLSNCATGAFYGYTPHRPDSAYTAVGGTYYYGNYNFITFFNSWFGNVWAPVYSWQFISQSANVDLTTLPVGQKATLTVVAKNVGTSVWANTGTNPTRLGTASPMDRSSGFVTSGWAGANRAAAAQESSVANGQNATFTFEIQAPNAPGSYNERFNLVTDGITWLNDPGMSFFIKVVPATLGSSLGANPLPVSIYTDADSGLLTATYTNTSNVTWYKDGRFPIWLGTDSPLDRMSPFVTTGWLAPNRVVQFNEAKVDPGGTATFTFHLLAPHLSGTYTESYRLVASSLAWFGQSLVKGISVNGAYDAQLIDATPVNVIAGSNVTMIVTMKNTGMNAWTNTNDGNGIRLGTEGPRNASSPFCNNWALGCNRPAMLNEANVASGANGTFTVSFASHYGQQGVYTQGMRLMNDNWGWLGPQVNAQINVAPAVFSYAITSQQAYTNSAKNVGLNLQTASPGQRGWLVLQIRNTGNVTWSNTGNFPVRLGTDGPRDRASRFTAPGWLAPNRAAALVEASVAPGAIGTFEWPMFVPNITGAFPEVYTPVAEGFIWMNYTGLSYYTVVNNYYAWQFVGQYAYTDATKSTPANMLTLAPGQRIYVSVAVRNIGGATWFKSGPYSFDLGTARQQDRMSPFCDSTWLGCNRPATMNESSVAPGGIANFDFYYKAPAIRAYFRDYFAPVIENIQWLSDQGLYFYSSTSNS